MVAVSLKKKKKQKKLKMQERMKKKIGKKSNGIGKKIWFELERIYPNTKVWETCTPYFDKRNIHFYVNVCGFHITEFFNEKHPMPDTPDDFVGDGNEGMFAFKKQMRL